MKQENKAFAFEALICRVQRLTILIKGMEAENKQREHLGRSMAYTEDSFAIEAEKYEDFAKQFEALGKS